jgi:uncharacterized protein
LERSLPTTSAKRFAACCQTIAKRWWTWRTSGPAEAPGGEQRRDPWIPDSLKEAENVGITDPDVLEAIRFYRESQYRHPNSTNRLLFVSYGSILSFDASSLVPELSTQPLQVIVGGRRGTTGQYESGQRLFDLSPSSEKDFMVVEGAGHYDMYYKPEYVGKAIDRLAAFYARYLNPNLPDISLH